MHEVVYEPESSAVFKGLDEFFHLAIVAKGNKGFFKGGAMLGAIGADEGGL